MFRETVEQRIVADHSDDGYLFPAYDDDSIANVPETALSVLDGSYRKRLPADVFDGVATNVDNVVLFVLDGFGLEAWYRHWQDDPFLRQVTEAGTVTPLTSIYPSETAAALTTLYTGLEPAEHGLLGWYQYLESVGEDIVTESYRKPTSFRGGSER
ncbi:alkaline phosphatase family protein [Natrialbaceae archaeon A-gly3]